MRQAADKGNVFHAVVPGIAVAFQQAGKTFQEVSGMFPLPAGLVFIQDDGGLFIIAGQIKLHIM